MVYKLIRKIALKNISNIESIGDIYIGKKIEESKRDEYFCPSAYCKNLLENDVYKDEESLNHLL